MKISIIAGRFNQKITENLIVGAQKALSENDLEKATIHWVPGAFEIPLAAKLLADKNDALIAVGTVIKGDTPHFDYVCTVCSDGISKVSLEQEIPIGFGIITTNNVDQAVERSSGDDKNVGYKAALAAIEMYKLKIDLAKSAE